MRIALLHDDFPPHHEGGSGVIALQLAKEYARSGNQVLVITSVQKRSDAGRAKEDGVEVVRLYTEYDLRLRSYVSLYNRSVLGSVERELAAFAPDAVHVHNVHLYLSYYSIVLARRYARRVYMTAHDAMSFHFQKLPSAEEDAYRESFWRQLKEHRVRYNPLRTPIIRHILNANLDGVVAVSESLARALRSSGIKNVSVIHNGIDASAWKMPAHKSVWEVGDAAILFGGRLSEQKGAYKMLDALAQIAKEVAGAQLLVIGKKDAQGAKMVEYAESLGVAERLVFTGWIQGEELSSAYHAAAVVCVPSIYLDPFPTINLEAFACAKPVVATRFGGSQEIVEDGVSGYVVDPFDTQLLAARISELLRNPEKARLMGAAGHERVVREFSLTAQAAAYERLFK